MGDGLERKVTLFHKANGTHLTVFCVDRDTGDIGRETFRLAFVPEGETFRLARVDEEGIDTAYLATTTHLFGGREAEIRRELTQHGIPAINREINGWHYLTAAVPNAFEKAHLPPEFVIQRSAVFTPQTAWLEETRTLEGAIAELHALGFRDNSFFAEDFAGFRKEYEVVNARTARRLKVSPLSEGEFNQFVAAVRERDEDGQLKRPYLYQQRSSTNFDSATSKQPTKRKPISKRTRKFVHEKTTLHHSSLPSVAALTNTMKSCCVP
jgi:hypothetical protein